MHSKIMYLLDYVFTYVVLYFMIIFALSIISYACFNSGVLYFIYIYIYILLKDNLKHDLFSLVILNQKYFIIYFA